MGKLDGDPLNLNEGRARISHSVISGNAIKLENQFEGETR
jgi:hypothetical protein